MESSNQHTLFYVHDPMCSWCWGFRPTLAVLMESLPAGIQARSLLGGLAPDSDEPMSPDMQQSLQATWRRIQERLPGTRFNFDFWRNCEPRRSTYPACRAVIAARILDPDREEPMILGIQEAYYARALNPSDDSTLVDLAGETGLDTLAFERQLHAAATERTLQREITLARTLGARSFPSLVLQTGPEKHWLIAIDYTIADNMLKQIQRHIA